MALDGSFVEKCLWFPRLTFSNVVGLSSWKPTPEESEGPPLNFYLSKNGKVEVIMSRFHLTIGCKMDFSNFPFDNQVAFLKILYSNLTILSKRSNLTDDVFIINFSNIRFVM